MKKYKVILPFLIVLMFLMGGCHSFDRDTSSMIQPYDTEEWVVQEREMEALPEMDSEDTEAIIRTIENALINVGQQEGENEPDKNIDEKTKLPAYDGDAFIIMNNNEPYFSESDKTRTDAFEEYSELDSLGRCGTAYANICKELMPKEDRENISEVIPSGWVNNPYDFIDGGYIYNRCHLIGFQLAGENANEKNLITGTRYMNVEGMLPFENMVDTYVEETKNHVLYRVTPEYEEENLVPSGVIMEAYSVEDFGKGIKFCIYCPNVQPGCEIDYSTGNNWEAEEVANQGEKLFDTYEKKKDVTYIINENSKKFHMLDCSSVADIKKDNRTETAKNREELLKEGYSPCGSCKP